MPAAVFMLYRFPATPMRFRREWVVAGLLGKEEHDMLELWADLTPLILASAALPLQTILTLRLVRSSRAAAFAWAAGMTTVRLVQGPLFKFVFTMNGNSSESSPQVLLGSFLLVMALLLYVKAF